MQILINHVILIITILLIYNCPSENNTIGKPKNTKQIIVSFI